MGLSKEGREETGFKRLGDLRGASRFFFREECGECRGWRSCKGDGEAGRIREIRFSGSGESFRGRDVRVETMGREVEAMERLATVEVGSRFEITGRRWGGRDFRETMGAAIVEGIGGATGVRQERIIGQRGGG